MQSYVFEWEHMCIKKTESVMKEYFFLDFPRFVSNRTSAFEAEWKDPIKREKLWVAASLPLPKAIAAGRWSSIFW